jgi:hypothetical protein
MRGADAGQAAKLRPAVPAVRVTAQAASIGIRCAAPFPALVIPPCRRLLPLPAETRPRVAMS